MAGGFFGGGTGTAASPYLIEDADDLNQVRNHLSSYFKLVSNINLGEPPYNEKEGWDPIEGFTGVLNGNCKRIFNLTITKPSTDNVGLFASYNVATAAKCQPVYDLGLENVNIIGHNNVGAVFGSIVGYNDSYALGTETSACLQRIYVSGYVEGNDAIGGLVGILESKGLATAGKTITVTADCLVNVSLNLTKVDSLNVGQVIGGYNDKWGSPATNSFLWFIRTMAIGELSGDSIVPLNPGNFFYNINGKGKYTNCYIDNSTWSVSDSGETDLIQYDTSEMKVASNFSFTNAYTDGQKVWSFYDGRYPQLMFASGDYFFVRADNNYYSYDFSNKKFVLRSSTTPTRQEAITYGNVQLQQIPSTAWAYFKDFKSVDLIDILDKTDTTVLTERSWAALPSEAYNSTNNRKNIYTQKFNFNTKFGNLSEVAGW